jgi:hypothetical protein
MAVSRAVMDSRKAWSCSHSGLLSRSPEIFTAALDIAERHIRQAENISIQMVKLVLKKREMGREGRREI